MRIITIPKRNGKKRTIYVPNGAQKSKLRSLVGQIGRKALRACPEGVCHGFARGRSPVTNALAHVGHQYTTCFDLKDFFDAVTESHLKGKLKDEELASVLVDGAPRQGLPTSPAVANLAASDMDKAILKWRDKHKLQFIYTRYADDLSFSYDDPSLMKLLLETIPQIVGRCGFKVNPEKTRTMNARSGRRIITGVAVDDAVHAPRRVKRRLRAALHQKNTAQSRGLAEWCKVKTPRERTQEKDIIGYELERLTRTWRLPKFNLNKLPDKTAEEDLGDGCIVTPDPVYMLGMSTWTTGWRSCMRQPNGQFRKGVVFWCYLRGTRVAAYLSDKTMVVAGVERRVMRARALVHELRNGAKVYDRLYGNPGDTDHLKGKLRAAGYISVEEARKQYGHGIKVVGHAPSGTRRPHFDNLSASTVTASEGSWKGKQVRVISI